MLNATHGAVCVCWHALGATPYAFMCVQLTAVAHIARLLCARHSQRAFEAAHSCITPGCMSSRQGATRTLPPSVSRGRDVPANPVKHGLLRCWTILARQIQKQLRHYSFARVDVETGQLCAAMRVQTPAHCQQLEIDSWCTRAHKNETEQFRNLCLYDSSLQLDLHVFFWERSNLCVGTPSLYLTNRPTIRETKTRLGNQFCTVNPLVKSERGSEQEGLGVNSTKL